MHKESPHAINSFHPTAEELKRSGMRQKAYGHVLSYHRDVRSVHAGYLKIVKADRETVLPSRKGGREGKRRKNCAVEEDGSFARVEGCI